MEEMPAEFGFQDSFSWLSADEEGNVYSVKMEENTYNDGNDFYGRVIAEKRNVQNELIWTTSFGDSVLVRNIVHTTGNRLVLLGMFYERMSAGDLSISEPHPPLGQPGLFVMTIDAFGVPELLIEPEPALSGIGNYIAHALATDPDQNVYIGYTDYMDGIIVKYDMSGNVISTISIGNIQLIGALQVDTDQNIYITGAKFEGPVDFAGLEMEAPYAYNCMAGKISHTGEGLWLRFFEDITNQYAPLVLTHTNEPTLAYSVFLETQIGDFTVVPESFGEEFTLIHLSTEGEVEWVAERHPGESFGGFYTATTNYLKKDMNDRIWLPLMVRGEVNFGSGVVLETGDLSQMDMAFVVYDSEGLPVFAQKLASDAWDFLKDISPGQPGGVYITGYTDSSIDLSPLEITPSDLRLRMTALLEMETTNMTVSDSDEATFYPNPSTGFITVRLPSAEIHMLEIFDSSGKKVLQRTVMSGNMTDINALAQGIYTLKISDPNNRPVVRKRIVKQ